MSYKIITDTTADLSMEIMKDLPEVEILPMNIKLGEDSYVYGPDGNIDVDTFYHIQRNGVYAATSQISPSVYYEYFKKYLEKGYDILYLSFSSGMSGTYQSSKIAIADLKEEYKDRTILSIDTLCASIGEGFLVHEAALRQAEGYSIDELYSWIEENRMNICHWFTVDHFEHLKHGGRVGAGTAVVGTMLQIKPLLHVDENGKLTLMDKPRGRKRAMECQLNKMQSGWQPDVSKYVVIGHSDNKEIAENLKESVSERFPDANVSITDIGPVIGAHTGPDMLALCYFGNNR